MRKFIFAVVALIAAASFIGNTPALANESQVVSVSSDSVVIRTDSIRAKGTRLGQRIVKGATLAADTIADRSKRVWKAATGKDVKKKE